MKTSLDKGKTETIAFSKGKNAKRLLKEAVGKLKEFMSDDQNVYFAFIFGSYVKGKQKKTSDLDIAIYFKNPPKGVDLLYLINTLSDLTGKEIDLVILNSASAFLRHQVMKYGSPLVVKDRNVYMRFREKTISDYDEYKFVSGMYVYD